MQGLVAELASRDVVQLEVGVGVQLLPVGEQVREGPYAVDLVRVELDLESILSQMRGFVRVGSKFGN
jgi:hypothetical protein